MPAKVHHLSAPQQMQYKLDINIFQKRGLALEIVHSHWGSKGRGGKKLWFCLLGSLHGWSSQAREL